MSGDYDLAAITACQEELQSMGVSAERLRLLGTGIDYFVVEYHALAKHTGGHIPPHGAHVRLQLWQHVTDAVRQAESSVKKLQWLRPLEPSDRELGVSTRVVFEHKDDTPNILTHGIVGRIVVDISVIIQYAEKTLHLKNPPLYFSVEGETIHKGETYDNSI